MGYSIFVPVNMSCSEKMVDVLMSEKVLEPIIRSGLCGLVCVKHCSM